MEMIGKLRSKHTEKYAFILGNTAYIRKSRVFWDNVLSRTEPGDDRFLQLSINYAATTL